MKMDDDSLDGIFYVRLQKQNKNITKQDEK